MKNIEETHPSLLKSKAITLWNSGEFTMDGYISRADDTAFTLIEIQKNTVDKKVLERALKAFLPYYATVDNVNEQNHLEQRLYFELGLK